MTFYRCPIFRNLLPIKNREPIFKLTDMPVGNTIILTLFHIPETSLTGFLKNIESNIDFGKKKLDYEHKTFPLPPSQINHVYTYFTIFFAWTYILNNQYVNFN